MQDAIEAAAVSLVDGPDLSQEALSALHSVYQQNAVAALDIIDRKAITRLICPRGRTVYQVRGHGDRIYLVFLEQHYCECAAYEYTGKVLINHPCKHILAVRLAKAMGIIPSETLSDLSFAQRLSPQAMFPTNA
eukprot:gene2398-5345_t